MISTKVDVLFDTNILIYILSGSISYRWFQEEFSSRELGISIISYIEILIGLKRGSEIVQVAHFLKEFAVIPLEETNVSELIVSLQGSEKNNLRNKNFADIAIGSTALALGVPLFTNNPKDFSDLYGLEVMEFTQDMTSSLKHD
jgi:predicted nucleic acid-binding protein